MKYLPTFFKPKKKYDLIRIGSDFDGGYLVEKQSIKNSKHLVPGRIFDNFTLEKHFKYLTDSTVDAFDPTVNRIFFRVFVFKLLRIFLMKENIQSH
jgi:hypothetical protein